MHHHLRIHLPKISNLCPKRRTTTDHTQLTDEICVRSIAKILVVRVMCKTEETPPPQVTSQQLKLAHQIAARELYTAKLVESYKIRLGKSTNSQQRGFADFRNQEGASIFKGGGEPEGNRIPRDSLMLGLFTPFLMMIYDGPQSDRGSGLCAAVRQRSPL